MLSDDSAPAPFVLTSQSLLSKRQEFTLHAKQYKTETILSHQHDFLNNINPKRNSNPNANNNNNTNSATTDEDVDRLVGFAEEEKENSCGDFSVSSTSSVQHNPHPATTRRLLEEEEERARALPMHEEGSNVTPPCDLENNKLTGDSASFDLLHCEAYVSNHRPYIHHHDNNESSPTSNYVSPDGNVYGKPFFCKGDSCPTAPLPHMESNMTLDKAKSEFYSVLPASETDKEEDLGDDPPNLSNTNHNNNNNNSKRFR
ncbi:hypothetical protein AGDE_12612 [Angomonas deanei]|uniref:Uncharacterized protein n=1 Tax=Angomonas deanei TaxID=59799 RepID=A0A7G2C5Q4_9TRYP|nr:hypothetical protein AGDE_12612 [Angomonas deanei]CAD2215076.1 hypothetical protein, conserved [Angomonas deanei]|eukprot:EPY23951.1 hypothetical protein AGDE_12612 [Angomonas deanei]